MVDTGGDRRVYVRAIELHRVIVFVRVRVQGASARLCGKAPGPGESRDQSRERGVGTARSAHAPGSVRGVGYTIILDPSSGRTVPVFRRVSAAC